MGDSKAQCQPGAGWKTTNDSGCSSSSPAANYFRFNPELEQQQASGASEQTNKLLACIFFGSKSASLSPVIVLRRLCDFARRLDDHHPPERNSDFELKLLLQLQVR